MRHVKRIPGLAVTVLLVLAGLASLLAGVYLFAGLALALVVGGALALVAGLLVDV